MTSSPSKATAHPTRRFRLAGRAVISAVAALFLVGVSTAPAAAAPAANAPDSITYSTPEPLSDKAVDTIVDETTAQMTREFAGTWRAGTPYVDPALSTVWDAKSKKLAQPMLGKAQRAGFPAYVAILPALQMPPGVSTYEARKRVYNKLFADFAASHATKNAALAIIEFGGTKRITGAAVRDGALLDDAVPMTTDLADDAAGPMVHYAVRAVLGAARGEPVTETTGVEREAWLPFGEPASFGAGGSGGINLVVTGSIVAGAGALAVVYLIGWAIVQVRRRRRASAERENHASAAKLSALRNQAASARRTVSKLAAGDGDARAARVKAAAACLPAPKDTADPVVLAAWIQLAGFGAGRGDVCFFDPTERATETRFSTEVGIDVPVCAAAADSIDHDEQPHYLSHDGFNTGKPYWTIGTSPFARSGFGAFTELAGEIIAAADDGRWSAADHSRAAASAGPEPRGGLPRLVTSRWTHAAVFLFVPVIIGLPVGMALTHGMEADFERVRSVAAEHPDPATLTNVDRVETVASALAASHVYVHSSMRPMVGTELEKSADAKAADTTNPIYVLAVPSDDGDDTAGDRRLLASRIAAKVDPDGLYVFVGASGGTYDYRFTSEPADREKARKLAEPIENESDTSAAIDGWIGYVDDVKWKKLGYDMDVESERPGRTAVYPPYGSQDYRANDTKSAVKGAVAGPIAEIVLVVAIIFIMNNDGRRRRNSGNS